MDRKELFQKISQHDFSRLYLFFGAESFVAEKALEQLRTSFLHTVEEGVNLIVFDGSECSPQAVAEQCETVSFLAAEKLVIVKDTPWLGAKEDSEACNIMERLFQTIGTDVILVFYSKTEVKKKSKLYSLIKKYGEIVEFLEVAGSELKAWIKKELAAYGKKISEENLRFLEEYCGAGLENLSNELNKLAFAAKETEISKQDILIAVTPGRDYNIFRISDYVLQGDEKSALALLEQLLLHKEEPVYILAIISKQIRNCAAVKQLSNKKMMRAEIASVLQMKDFAVDRMQRIAVQISDEKFTKAIAMLLNADIALKSRNQDVITMQTLLIKLCRLLKVS